MLAVFAGACASDPGPSKEETAKHFRVVYETGAPVDPERRVSSSAEGGDPEVAKQNVAIVVADDETAAALAREPNVLSVTEVPTR